MKPSHPESRPRTRWLAALSCLTLAGAALAHHPARAATAPVTTQVRTDAGSVAGLSTSTGLSFWGIPFAAPPVGTLRWKAPAPVQPWSGVRAATTPGHACKQDGSLPPAGVGDSAEDCLYLNVHVPAGLTNASKAPVMFWIHGGAFITGSGSQYDGSRLAAATGSVVVTTNYRLGIFGMLALDALLAESPAGNPGLMDQQAALRWVKRNIAAFGGDPARVTIFGQSAGGASVCQQLASPTAAGLFHRAILQSGPCTFGTATKAAAITAGNAFADRLGCPTSMGATAQLACLRSKSSDEVFAAAPAFDFNDLRTLTAVTPYEDGVTLTAQPKDLVKQGKFNRVPVMIGSTKDEARLFIALAFDIRNGAAMTDAQYTAFIAALSGGNATAAQTIAGLYTSSKYGSPGLAASALMTDASFACGTQWSARQFSNYVATYTYEFQDQTVPPLVPDPFMAWGAYHASELPFLFQSAVASTPPSPDPMSNFTTAQKQLASQMVGYWGRFAATGNPNGNGQLNWPRFGLLAQNTLTLNSTGNGVNLSGGIASQHQCLLWDSIASLGVTP